MNHRDEQTNGRRRVISELRFIPDISCKHRSTPMMLEVSQKCSILTKKQKSHIVSRDSFVRNFKYRDDSSDASSHMWYEWGREGGGEACGDDFTSILAKREYPAPTRHCAMNSFYRPTGRHNRLEMTDRGGSRDIRREFWSENLFEVGYFKDQERAAKCVDTAYWK